MDDRTNIPETEHETEQEVKKRRIAVRHLGTRRIETDRLILRRFTADDAELMYKNWASDPEVTRYLMWPVHENAEVTKALLKVWVDAYSDEKKYEWCISLKETGEPIGSMGVAQINERAESMEIGYCIGRAYWHQGFTSEALAAVMQYLLNEVGARRIEARHDPKNPYSGAVMKKCGMQYEGTKIQGDWNNTGICDCALYGYVKGITGKKLEAAAKSIISDETIEYVGILAKLELSETEKEQARKDMGEMLDYIDKLNELDTEGVEPMSHIFPVQNVFREDVITNGDGSMDTLSNAPQEKEGGFQVPKTIA